MLTETLIDWNINRKLSTITIDNCITNDALIHLLLDKHTTNDMPLDGKSWTCVLEENLLPRARDFNILNWWKTNGVKFPTLQKMVKDSLAIPVSIVASEFAFSSSRGRLARSRFLKRQDGSRVQTNQAHCVASPRNEAPTMVYPQVLSFLALEYKQTQVKASRGGYNLNAL
ncbi:Zinc finger BED domain-containing protein RICESLEEPER 3 [Sesamum angolense]|uniref:Zinc finger BED domain-containing protein RICESLEEPER 3 n=1 Tax=Sesamum angolense TaxID=2727404 RepID=A0AAE1T6B2_9LAMI|nr:Zinc finger BED domain-containing protein RICESLEEPER 3 [Sesamum angolense]